MPSTRDLRRRIKSVKNTAQITKAMQMVAASKMRRAQQSALAGRSYAKLMNEVLAEVTAGTTDFSHPLMEENQAEKQALVIVSPDKGLCGALNTNLLREAARTEPARTLYVTAGKKGSQYVARTKRELVAEFSYKDSPLFSEARSISKFVQDLFLEGKVNKVDVLYMDFISTLNQRPTVHPLLPVGQLRGVSAGVNGEEAEAREDLEKGAVDFIFEPTANQVLGNLLPHYLNFQMYQILLEAKASEHSARMVAMKNATDNANQLIKDLTLEFNKVRQASITSELLEISTAAMALE